MSAAVLTGLLVAAGVWLVLRRDLVRVALGFVLLGHAVNVLLLAAGGTDRRGPAVAGLTPLEEAADPLPQAFALTAIVISFAVAVLLVALAGRAEGQDDDADDDADAGGEAR